MKDVSRNASCDLICRNGSENLFVEVKGTTTTGESILLTPNEVELAEREYPRTAAFIVSGIILQVGDDGALVATGGNEREIRPWNPGNFTLRPVTLECLLS